MGSTLLPLGRWLLRGEGEVRVDLGKYQVVCHRGRDLHLSRSVPCGTRCRAENGSGCPPTPMCPWPLEAVPESGAGAR